MKAMLSKQVGGPETLVLEDLPDPKPRAGEVLIAVKACGVNYPDLLIIEDRYQFKPARPFAPGGEVAGVVEAVGAGVTGFKPGDRVIGSTIAGGMAEKLARGGGALHPDARRHAVRRGQRHDPDLRHVDPRAQGPRQDQAGRDAAGAGRGGRRRALGGGARQGLRRARDRRRLLGGEARVRQAARRRQRRGLSARPVRQGRLQGAGRPVQGRLRREGCRRDLRSCRRRLFGGRARAPSPGRGASWWSASRPASPSCRST